MKICTKCKQPGEFCKDKQKGDSLCSICKKCNRAAVAKWQLANPRKINDKTKKWQQKNRQKVVASRKKYGQNNKGKINAKTAKYHAAKLQRTPSWLTEEHYDKIEKFYVKASNMTKEFNIPFEVDHIIPLQGKNISGLHVPWNLQIITEKENCIKSNRLA